MPWGYAAAAAIAAGGSIWAANEQKKGTEQASDTQMEMFKTITGQEQPFLKSGQNAQGVLNYLMGIKGEPGDGTPYNPIPGLDAGYLTKTFNPTQQDLENYPGYQWQKQQGQLALNSANSATTGALSGAALKSLMGFNQGLAASNYQDYFNQFQSQQTNIFNRLNSIAQLGQNAAGNLGNAGTQLGANIAGAQAAGANALAGGIVGATNSISNGVQLAALLNGGYGGNWGGPSGGALSSGGSDVFGSGWGG